MSELKGNSTVCDTAAKTQDQKPDYYHLIALMPASRWSPRHPMGMPPPRTDVRFLAQARKAGMTEIGAKRTRAVTGLGVKAQPSPKDSQFRV